MRGIRFHALTGKWIPLLFGVAGVAGSCRASVLEFARLTGGAGDGGESAKIEAFSRTISDTFSEGDDWFLDGEAALALRVDTWGNFQLSPGFRQEELQALELREAVLRRVSFESSVAMGKIVLPAGLNRGFNPNDPSPLSFANPFAPDRKAVWGVLGESNGFFGSAYLAQGSLFLTEGPYRLAPAGILEDASYGSEWAAIVGWRGVMGALEAEVSLGYGIDPNPIPAGAGIRFPEQKRVGAGLRWTGRDWIVSGEIDLRREEASDDYGWVVLEVERSWTFAHSGAVLNTLLFGSFLIGDYSPLAFDRLRKDSAGFILDLDPNGRDVFSATASVSRSLEGSDYVFSPGIALRLSETAWIRLQHQSSLVSDIPEERTQRTELSVSHRF